MEVVGGGVLIEGCWGRRGRWGLFSVLDGFWDGGAGYDTKSCVAI